MSTDKPLDPTRRRLLVRQEEMKLIDPTAGPAIPGVDSPREFTTAQRAVAKLEELSIITEISRAKRDRIYCARALLGILEEPARLTSMEV